MNSGASLTLQDLTLTGGLAQGFSFAGGGGAIYNAGILAINNCTLADNTADNFGGGICNTGRANVSNSTLADNNSNHDGAAFTTTPPPRSTSTTAPSRTIRAAAVAFTTLARASWATALWPNAPPYFEGIPAGGTDVGGIFTSEGHNLIGVQDGYASGFTNGINGDIVGTTDSPVVLYWQAWATTADPRKQWRCCPVAPPSTPAATP